MTEKPKHVMSFGISLSRLLFAKKYLEEFGAGSASLFVAGLDKILIATDSIDIFLTGSSIEPNHWSEKHILPELIRVARRHLVLIKPNYETASGDAKTRMERPGYVRGLPSILEELNYPARRIEPFEANSNAMNKASLIVVDKNSAASDTEPAFVLPISGGPLVKSDDCRFCPGDGHAYSIICDLPCLTIESAILASRMESRA